MDKMKKGAMDGARDMIFETRYGHFLPFCIFYCCQCPWTLVSYFLSFHCQNVSINELHISTVLDKMKK